MTTRTSAIKNDRVVCFLHIKVREGVVLGLMKKIKKIDTTTLLN
jgi:hypothetical protein